MKTIGAIILLTIFLTGAYLLGNHKEAASYKKKIDSLQYAISNRDVEIKLLKVSLDSSKYISAMCAKNPTSTMQKPKKKIH